MAVWLCSMQDTMRTTYFRRMAFFSAWSLREVTERQQALQTWHVQFAPIVQEADS